ncbi:hypothetical protein F2Q70_00011378 [Brassica cretica]|uniref:Uncharacterized protein n=1 Tax=Brassica cretica TaxID=69181 RepID=A0A8S9M754_BRACR|nr:hypothetical protein F2Q70_00011378 [Brassica cretica]
MVPKVGYHRYTEDTGVEVSRTGQAQVELAVRADSRDGRTRRRTQPRDGSARRRADRRGGLARRAGATTRRFGAVVEISTYSFLLFGGVCQVVLGSWLIARPKAMMTLILGHAPSSGLHVSFVGFSFLAGSSRLLGIGTLTGPISNNSPPLLSMPDFPDGIARRCERELTRFGSVHRDDMYGCNGTKHDGIEALRENPKLDENPNFGIMEVSDQAEESGNIYHQGEPLALDCLGWDSEGLYLLVGDCNSLSNIRTAGVDFIPFVNGTGCKALCLDTAGRVSGGTGRGRGVDFVTLAGSSLTRHVALPDHGVGLDGQSCSCLIVGSIISNPGCWTDGSGVLQAVPGTVPGTLRSGDPGCLLVGTPRPVSCLGSGEIQYLSIFPQQFAPYCSISSSNSGITCALKSTGVAHSQQDYLRQDIAPVILRSRVPLRPEPHSEPVGGPVPLHQTGKQAWGLEREFVRDSRSNFGSSRVFRSPFVTREGTVLMKPRSSFPRVASSLWCVETFLGFTTPLFALAA